MKQLNYSKFHHNSTPRTPIPGLESFNLNNDYSETYHNYPCPHCDCKKAIELEAPPPHHKKLICSECERFLKWLPNPQTVINHELLRVRLDLALKRNLKGWDRDFVYSLDKQWHEAERKDKFLKLSPNQEDQLERIEAEAV